MNWKSNFFRKNNNQPRAKKSVTREWLDAFVFALVASTIIRGLLFSAYAIPSGSMEGTQLPGDNLFVSKLSYGPRVAITPIALPFTEPVVKGVKTYWSGIQLPYMRLPGLSSPQKGDIVVFNKPDEAGPEYNIPIDERTTLIKRCQAIPGDVLTIVNSQVYINGKPMVNAPKAQTSYAVITDGADLNPKLLEDMRITVRQQYSPNTFEMIIPRDQLDAFKSITNIKGVQPIVQAPGMYDADVFPHSEKFKWNIDNYGPLKMPAKGWTVTLNDSTLTLYRRAIEMYENNKVEVKGKNVFINGKKTTAYTFKMDYYWMMGDNRHDSLDSRFWGYVPEDHIIGKAKLTWFSTDSTKNIISGMRWDRVLRPIH